MHGRRGALNEEQWKLANDLATDLRVLTTLVPTYVLSDPIQRLLQSWATLLGALAAEVFDSVVILARLGNLRVAYTITRSLIEYAIRLAYYHKEADRVQQDEAATGMAGPAYIGTTEVYRDLVNSEQSFLANMKLAPSLDFMTLSPADRQYLDELLAEDTKARRARWSDMVKLAEQENATRRRLLSAEYDLRSGYLHGNQIAAIEVFARRDYKHSFLDSLLTEERVVGYAMQYAIQFLENVGEAVGREYAAAHYARRMYELFDITSIDDGES